MQTSENVPELREFPENSLQLLSPGVTLNQVVHTESLKTTCMDADCRRPVHRGRQTKHEFKIQPARVEQQVEQEDRGAAAAGTRLHLQPRDTRLAGADHLCWVCGVSRCGTTNPENKDTAREDKYTFQLQSDDEELELPLPLRSDDEWQWQYYSPFVPHHQDSYNYGLHHSVDVRCYHCAGEGQCNLSPDTRYLPQPRLHSTPCLHSQPRVTSQNRFRRHDRVDQASVSINMPQFSIPPVELVPQVRAMNLGSAGAEPHVSSSRGKTRTGGRPDKCRNIFITHSSDSSSAIVPFVDFLINQGFRPVIDLSDNSVRPMDSSKWKDSYLNDPSNLIIIAISPKYKADVEGFVVDSQGLQTKYIHSMMQNEFIQQGSLNFRFIPVLFLNASQEHVPAWLRNTCIYQWPRDTEDVLLRLLMEERYLPPPVPLQLSLFIKPVTPSSAAAL